MKPRSTTAIIQTSLNDRHDEIVQRETDLHRLANSVKDLSDTFIYVHDLVVDQGSMIDNIEQNIETSSQRMKTAKVELEKAEETQEKTCRIL